MDCRWKHSGSLGSQVILVTQLYEREVPRYRKWKRINLSRINIGALVAIIITKILKIIMSLKLTTGINAMEGELCKKHKTQ
jgi:dipeptide/tripeptide permease